jgi:CHAT domain-containing protein
MDLRGTRLVVLSACDTGSGDAGLGESVIGLRSAFLAAGANAVAATLWSVDDAATAELISDMFTELKPKVTPSKALQLAQLRYIEKARAKQKNMDPYYWAAFTITER